MALITVKKYCDSMTGNTIAQRIDAARASLFTGSITWPSNVTGSKVLDALLLKYYKYEFCEHEEDLELWSLEATDHINELLEKYKPLWESATLITHPLQNMSHSKSHTGTSSSLTNISGNNDSTVTTDNDGSVNHTESDTAENSVGRTSQENRGKASTNSHSSTTNVDNDTTGYEYNIDTPQGATGSGDVNILLNAGYLSNAKKTTSNNDTDTTFAESSSSADTERVQGIDTESNTHQGEKTSVDTTTNDTTQRTVGINSSETTTSASNGGTESDTGYSGITEAEMVMKYRETMDTIEKDFLDECAPLFVLCW